MALIRNPLDFSEFFNSEALSDTTITVTDENGTSKKFFVHKIVLVTASPFFNNIYVTNAPESCTEPFNLAMSIAVFENILRFLYLGQLVIDESELKEFIKEMTTLELVGMISTAASEEAMDESEASGSNPGPSSSAGSSSAAQSKKKIKKEKIKQDPDAMNQDIKPEMESLSEFNVKVKKLVGFNESTRKFVCTLCNKECATRHTTACHIKVKHLDRADYECSYCQTMFKTDLQLNNHIFKKHRMEHKLSKTFGS